MQRGRGALRGDVHPRALAAGGNTVRRARAQLRAGPGHGPPFPGKVPPELDAIRKPTKEHFYRLFREAWDSVNLDRQRDTAIDLAIDEDTVRGALAVEQPDRAWMSPLKRVFRPIKPVIDPLLRAALPLLGRAAIRRSQG